MTTYPKSRRVIIAQSPGQGGPLPFFGTVPSNSATRMDSLMPDWRDHALGVNAYWHAEDWTWARAHHVREIVEETECEVVVGLGGFVHEALGMPKKIMFFDWVDIKPAGRPMKGLVFPHPSGRSRFWNNERNRAEAAAALREALTC